MRAGLLGRTLGHSHSPAIHRFFGDYGYELFEREPDRVADFVRAGDFGFLNVTIPYKRTVAGLCDVLSPLARRLGNVNFIARDDAGRLAGDNTDAFGFARLMASTGFDVRGRNAAVLGAGGAAETGRAVLGDLGAARVRLVRRGESPAADDALIVNATPVGMFPDTDGVRVDIRDFPACEAVVDLVYNPSPTRLVREARALGKAAADGMVMLVAQAYRAFELAVAPREPLRTLYLYGPPASGKSTWGRLIAQATGLDFVDLDAEIVRRAGRTIPEIFAADGERTFRRLERETLGAVVAAASSPRVVALGGGALLDPESRRLAESTGRVVVLSCPEETLFSRLTGGSRPLSTGRESLAALLASRRDHYGSFSRQVAFAGG